MTSFSGLWRDLTSPRTSRKHPTRISFGSGVLVSRNLVSMYGKLNLTVKKPRRAISTWKNVMRGELIDFLAPCAMTIVVESDGSLSGGRPVDHADLPLCAPWNRFGFQFYRGGRDFQGESCTWFHRLV